MRTVAELIARLTQLNYVNLALPVQSSSGDTLDSYIEIRPDVVIIHNVDPDEGEE